MTSISRKNFLKVAGAAALAASPIGRVLSKTRGRARRPNIILILGDDLGYAELGCYGQQKIRTPRIDALAREGVRFTQCYAGSPVCAPSRCVLLTGKHAGHAFVRDNHEIEPEGQLPLPADTVTLPRLLQQEGYRTALIGKWGLGYPGSTGDPVKQGFDRFFGYNCQRHAHDHYPSYLWRDTTKIDLRAGMPPDSPPPFAPDLMEAEALEFISTNQEVPFFLFFATTLPHLALQVPDEMRDAYGDGWDDPSYDGSQGYLPCKRPRATYAGMVSHLDRTVGHIIDRLASLGIDGDTILIFASDNGSTFRIGGYDPPFFQGTGPFRAAKGSVYEGGLRVPLIVHWPGVIAGHRTSDQVCAFQDLLPTILELTGAAGRIPADADGISLAPGLLGRPGQAEHANLYFEFPGYGGQQMVRVENWTGVRQNLIQAPAGPLELYDLSNDIGQHHDVAAGHPGMVARMSSILRASHRPSVAFPFPALDDR